MHLKENKMTLLELLIKVREHLLDTSGECYLTGCPCEGNEESKELMQALEDEIVKQGGKL
jgi:hypothetical protein